MASQTPKSETMNFQLLIDSIPALIHTALPNGDLDYFNRTWLNYVGLTLAVLVGWKRMAAIHPEDVPGIVEAWRAAVATGKPFEHEARMRRADGTFLPCVNARKTFPCWFGISSSYSRGK
jgi:hypothetical protein